MKKHSSRTLTMIANNIYELKNPIIANAKSYGGNVLVELFSNTNITDVWEVLKDFTHVENGEHEINVIGFMLQVHQVKFEDNKIKKIIYKIK